MTIRDPLLRDALYAADEAVFKAMALNADTPGAHRLTPAHTTRLAVEAALGVMRERDPGDAPMEKLIAELERQREEWRGLYEDTEDARRDLLSACKQWRQVTEAHEAEWETSPDSIDQALIDAIDKAEGAGS